MTEEERNIFKKTLSEASPVPLEAGTLEKMAGFCDLLFEKNKVMNLTAVKTPQAAAILHFADSLYALTAGEITGSVLDVGSGGGFPAFPVAAASGAQVTALDSTAKKLNFIKEAAAACGVTNIGTLCGRAEELSHRTEYREAYDTVLARGVARLNVLCEWCMPFVRVGGRFIAMKGSRGEEELEEAQNAVKTLGGRVALLKKYRLPDENRDYALIIIEKISATPEMYPRHNSKIERNPL